MEQLPYDPSHWPSWHMISQVPSLGSGQIIVAWSPSLFMRAFVGIEGLSQPIARENTGIKLGKLVSVSIAVQLQSYTLLQIYTWNSTLTVTVTLWMKDTTIIKNGVTIYVCCYFVLYLHTPSQNMKHPLGFRSAHQSIYLRFWLLTYTRAVSVSLLHKQS